MFQKTVIAAKDRIKAIREKLGISQVEAARRIRRTKQQWGQWEAGTHEPQLPVLREISAALGCSLADLTGE